MNVRDHDGKLKLHAKPIGLLNTAGFFDPLMGWITTIARGRRQKYRDALIVEAGVERILDRSVHAPRRGGWGPTRSHEATSAARLAAKRVMALGSAAP